MDYRAELHLYDLQETKQFGLYLNEPSNQLVRLVSLFNVKQRIEFLKDAKHVIEATCPKSSLIQFAALFMLHDCLHDQNTNLSGDKFEELFELSERALTKGSYVILVSRLPTSIKQCAFSVASGENYYGVALILANTLLAYDLTQNVELTHLITRTVKQSVVTAEQAAAVASTIEYTNQDILRFEWKAGCLVDETRIFPDACFSSVHEKRALLDVANSLDGTIKDFRETREAILKQQREITSITELCHKFRLAQDPTGIFIPLRKHILVARSIAEAQKLAHDSRDLVLAMSPREFEEFMANIFHDLGFDVELTKTSRDGGADLICMRSLLGIPIRLAVEVKRYKEKPVDVSLVRSFVGANKQWQANRLIYVTTSRYTRSAYEFAENYASHILTLKDYDQIIEWCKYIQKRPNPLL